MSTGPGINYPYKRRMILEFTNLKGGRSVSYQSTGEMNSLRASVQIEKTLTGIPSAAKLDLFNLSADTRSSFSESVQGSNISQKPRVRIYAGWDNGPRFIAPHPQVYYGNVLTAESTRNGENIITSIQSLSFVDCLLDAKVKESWAGGVSVLLAIKTIANKIEGIETLEDGRIKGITGTFGSGGWVASGTVKTEMDKLADEYGFSWNIVDGKFQAIADQDGLGQISVVQDPYLSYINPYVGGPQLFTTGIRFGCLFDPTLTPGQYAQVTSKLASRYNGTYRLNQVAHTLDCFNQGGGFTSSAIARVQSRIEGV